MGHSLGGSIVSKVVYSIECNKHKSIDRICGCVILDVIEGSALDALPFMANIARERPK